MEWKAYSVETASALAECLAIRRKVFVEEQGVPEPLERDEYDASPAACGHVLLACGQTPVGTGRWIPRSDDTAKIQRLAVLPEYRGKGAGKRLLRELESQARLAGYRHCILDSQCHAEPFYARLGYTATSDRPFEEAGIMHVRMRKSL